MRNGDTHPSPPVDIFEACVACDPIALAASLGQGGRPDDRDGEGRPTWEVLLFGPETTEQAACLGLLLGAGMRMNLASRKGFPLLWEIALQGRQECAQVLLEARGAKRVMGRMDKDLGGKMDQWRTWWEGQLAEHQARCIQHATPASRPRRGGGPRL